MKPERKLKGFFRLIQIISDLFFPLFLLPFFQRTLLQNPRNISVSLQSGCKDRQAFFSRNTQTNFILSLFKPSLFLPLLVNVL